MANKNIHSGAIVDNSVTFTLQEMCDICGVSEQFVVEMVEFGILEPQGNTMGNWRFSAVSLRRSKRAVRLQHDLELNLAGVGLTLDLLEELERHRERIEQLEHLLKLLHAS